MKTRVDATLREESARFRLRHTCDDCVHFDGDACVHGYPTAPHRRPVDHPRHEELVFCKEFELG